jgi:hypothetical protein
MQTKDLINLDGIPEEHFIRELVEKLSARTTYEDKAHPRSVMDYKQICSHDDGWLCECRLQFIVNFLKRECL